MNLYDVTVHRKISTTFRIEARNRAEASMKLGEMIAGDPDVFDDVSTVELDRRVMSPSLIGKSDPTLDVDGATESK